MTLRISVVIPAHNRAHLLGETLDSVLAQDHPPHEVIVVDDGSTDATLSMLEAYAGRIKVGCIPHSGAMVARNAGLRLASGEVVAFCDSDDVWLPGHLEALARLWEAAPGLNAAYANFRLVRDGVWAERDKFSDAPPGFFAGARLLGGGLALFDEPPFPRLLRFTPFFPSALAARRDFLLRAGGWDEAAPHGASSDFATALRIAEHPRIGLVLSATVSIRQPVRLSPAQLQRMNLHDAAILDHVLASRPSLLPHDAAIRASARRRRLQALETAFVRQDFAAVRAIAARLGATPPLRVHAKIGVAALPPGLRTVAARTLLSLGTLRSQTLRRVAQGA